MTSGNNSKRCLLNIWLSIIVLLLFTVDFIVIHRVVNPLSILGLLLYSIMLAAYIWEYRHEKKEEKNKQLLNILLREEP